MKNASLFDFCSFSNFLHKMKFLIKLHKNAMNTKLHTFSFVMFCMGQFITPSSARSTEKINVQGTLDTIDCSTIKIESNYTGPKLEDGKITLTFMKDLIQFYKEGNILHQKYVFMILTQVRDHFKKQPSLIEVKLPAKEKITVCGNIHGNMHNVVHNFDLHGFPSETNRYLFNGDFVDKGYRSVECALIHFGFKLLYPDTFFINRGNHEDMHQNYEDGGLVDRVQERYPGNKKLLHGFWEVFQWLPLAHIISSDVTPKSGGQTDRVGFYAPIYGKVLVVHGGLFSKKDVTLDDIRQTKRGCDVEDVGEKSLMFDILWSDPTNIDTANKTDLRETSIRFGPNESESFCNRNKIDYIIRSHIPLQEGYRPEHNGRILTIFSATDYEGGNKKGAVAVLEAPELRPKISIYKYKFDFGVDGETIIDHWKDEKDVLIE